MKKILLLLFILLLSIPTYSQKGAYIGIRLIPQSAWILNQDDFDSDDFDFGVPFSFAFALGGGYMFSDVVGVETQMLYSPQGQKYIDSETSEEININNNYFKIPVLFRFRSEAEKVGFLFNIGPEFGFLVGSSINSSGGDLPPEFLGDTRNLYENFEFSVALGLGTSISLSSNLQLDLLINLNYGLSEIESTAGKELLFDYQNNGRASSNNAVAGFSVGLNYLFGKSNSDTQTPVLE